MIANFFRKTKPIHAIFIGLFFSVFYIASILFIEKPELSLNLVGQKFFGAILFLILFFLFRFINRKNHLSGQDSYFLLLLMFLFAMFPRTMLLDKVFAAHFILILAFRRIYSMRSLKSVSQKVFDSAFWIGLASIIYLWSVLYLVLVFVAILIYKKEEIRNLIIGMVAFVTPWFLIFTFYFVTDKGGVFYDKLMLEYAFSTDVYKGVQFLIPVYFISIFTFGAIAVVRVRMNSLTNDLKPSWALLVSHLLLAICIIMFSFEKNGADFVFAFFPIAIFLANILQLIKKVVMLEIVVSIFIGLSVMAYIL